MTAAAWFVFALAVAVLLVYGAAAVVLVRLAWRDRRDADVFDVADRDEMARYQALRAVINEHATSAATPRPVRLINGDKT